MLLERLQLLLLDGVYANEDYKLCKSLLDGVPGYWYETFCMGNDQKMHFESNYYHFWSNWLQMFIKFKLKQQMSL